MFHGYPGEERVQRTKSGLIRCPSPTHRARLYGIQNVQSHTRPIVPFGSQPLERGRHPEVTLLMRKHDQVTTDWRHDGCREREEDKRLGRDARMGVDKRRRVCCGYHTHTLRPVASWNNIPPRHVAIHSERLEVLSSCTKQMCPSTLPPLMLLIYTR